MFRGEMCFADAYNMAPRSSSCSLVVRHIYDEMLLDVLFPAQSAHNFVSQFS